MTGAAAHHAKLLFLFGVQLSGQPLQHDTRKADDGLERVRNSCDIVARKADLV